MLTPCFPWSERCMLDRILAEVDICYMTRYDNQHPDLSAMLCVLDAKYKLYAFILKKVGLT